MVKPQSYPEAVKGGGYLPRPYPARLCAPVVASAGRVRGSAMTETVLVLPFILVVLALLFFFGQAMTRWQRSSVTDRYEAWRQTQYAPSPGIRFAKNPTVFEDSDSLNELFFAGNAERLDIGERSGRVYLQSITDTIANEAIDSGRSLTYPDYNVEMAADLIRERDLRLPAWWRIDLETEHTSDIPLYQRYAGAVRHQHTVIDGDWAYGSWIEQRYRGERDHLGDILVNDVHFIGDNAFDGDNYPDLDHLKPHSIIGLYEIFYHNEAYDHVAEKYLYDLDEQNDNPLARSVRQVYLSIAGYRGPQVLPELVPVMLWYRPMPAPDPGSAMD